MNAPRKGKFCEEHYLDERAMAEIENVTRQLEDTVSSLGAAVLNGTAQANTHEKVHFPVTDEKLMDRYLSCVAAGLVQFVCVREEREPDSLGRRRPPSRNSPVMYRSLTADRIMIHPGSVMFKSDPQFIVAGEIVKTARTYAMSVSPLKRFIIEEITPELARYAPVRKGSAGKRPAREDLVQNERDWTNNIRIMGESFPIKTIKGRKIAVLPWEQLAKLKEYAIYGGLGENFPGKLRGAITVGEDLVMLAGEKLSLILRLLPALDPTPALSPSGETIKTLKARPVYSSLDKPEALINELHLLMTASLWKEKEKKKPKDQKESRREIGFIGLFSDGMGAYWFRVSRGFYTALNESLSSLENLIDELGEDVPIEQKHVVNQAYRRLSDMLS
jgi:hypothetical protein